MQNRLNEPNPNFLTDLFVQRPEAYVELIIAGASDHRSQFMALYGMLKTANTAPPAAWVEMREEYPIKYLAEVMPALIKAEKQARTLLPSIPSAFREAYKFDLEWQAIHCANQRVALVLSIAAIRMNFKVLVRNPELFQHFLRVMRDDFFKVNSRENRAAYLSVMRFTLKALRRAESLDQGVLRLVQQCLEVYEANSPKGVWYADYKAVSDLWVQLFALFDKEAGLIQAREGRDEAASALLALSGAMQEEGGSQATKEVREPAGRDQAVQAPKRQKISAQPASLFHPPVVAPVPVGSSKIRMFVVSK